LSPIGDRIGLVIAAKLGQDQHQQDACQTVANAPALTPVFQFEQIGIQAVDVKEDPRLWLNFFAFEIACVRLHFDLPRLLLVSTLNLPKKVFFV
jgi:hypothetical protein